MPRKKPAATEPTPPLRRSLRKRTSAATELEAEGSQNKRVKPSAKAIEITPNSPSSLARPAPTDRTIASAAAALPHRIPSPNFSGNFDIYHMNIAGFSEVYTNLQVDGSLNIELLYQQILEFQQDNIYSGQVYLASPQPESEAAQLSQLKDRTLCGLDGTPYSILLRDIEHHDQITMPPMEFTFHDSDVSGISAHLSLLDENGLVAGSIGALHFRRIWTKMKDNGEIHELFAGHLSFKTIFYSHKGQGSGQEWNFSVWAVRARIGENGQEIGLVKNIPGVPITATSQEPAKHPKARIPEYPESNMYEADFPPEGDEREDEEDEEITDSEFERFIGEVIMHFAIGFATTMELHMRSLLASFER